MVSLLFRYTTTIGIRESRMNRYLLDRTVEVLDTPFGGVRRKLVKGYGTERFKYEYEDLSRIAAGRGISLDQVKELIRQKENYHTDDDEV